MLFALLLLFVHEAVGVHDSMNFVLPAGQRECFYEDFDKNSPTKTIDVFVSSGGNLDIILTVHGPLELDDIRKVCAYYSYNIVIL